MPYRQRIAFLSALLLLLLGYLYAEVPARYIPESEKSFTAAPKVSFGSGLTEEAAMLGGKADGVSSEDYTASALDALSY